MTGAGGHYAEQSCGFGIAPETRSRDVHLGRDATLRLVCRYADIAPGAAVRSEADRCKAVVMLQVGVEAEIIRRHRLIDVARQRKTVALAIPATRPQQPARLLRGYGH